MAKEPQGAEGGSGTKDLRTTIGLSNKDYLQDGTQSELLATRILTLRVSVEQQFVGRVPGGYRIDLSYSGARPQDPSAKGPLLAVLGPKVDATLKGYLDHGCILSGNDWVTINSETAFDFDSRITLALSPGGTADCPVAGRLRGRAQIRDRRNKNGGRYYAKDEAASRVFADWRAGFEEGDYLPLVLSASFDVPVTGLDDMQTKVYNKARALANSLFIGQGRAIYGRGSYGSVEEIQLNLYAIEPATNVRSEEKQSYDAAS
jgi:hypothetical protein